MYSLKTIFISAVVILACLFAVYGVYKRYFSMTAKLDRYVQTYVDLNLFSGVILVAKDGKIILCKAYGMADFELDVPNKIDTKFRLGSITKQFTAMAIMQLQEMGRLNVQDSLLKYIPDYPRGNEITIHNLLTHTSGIPNVTSFPEYSKKKIKPHTLEQLIQRFKDKPLEFTPGEKYAYSNSNYIVLTYILEKASGKKYEIFLKEHIFDPLAMKDTGCDDYGRIIKNRASGYSFVDGELVNAGYIDMSFPVGAGALYSTVQDLYRWDRALYTKKLVAQEFLNKIFTPFKETYGYGWFIETSPYGKVIQHGGGIDGFAAQISRYVDRNTCIIVLSNFESVSVQMVNNLSRILFGQKPEYTPKKHAAVVVSPQIYDQYVGTYKAHKKDSTFVVTKDHDRLFIERIEKKDKREVYPETETEFFLKSLDVQFSFIKDKNGNVVRLVLHQQGNDISFERVK